MSTPRYSRSSRIHDVVQSCPAGMRALRFIRPMPKPWRRPYRDDSYQDRAKRRKRPPFEVPRGRPDHTNGDGADEHPWETLSEVTVVGYRHLEDLGPGWLYLYDVGKATWHEYEVLAEEGAVARYKEVPAVRSGHDVREATGRVSYVVWVCEEAIYYVAFSTVQWSQRRFDSLAVPSARIARMKLLLPGDERPRELLYTLSAFENRRDIAAAVDNEMDGQTWGTVVVPDAVSSVMRKALNYQAARSCMADYLSDLEGDKWFRAAMLINPLRGPVGEAVRGDLTYLDEGAIDKVLGRHHREDLRDAIKGNKGMLVYALRKDTLDLKDNWLLTSLHDYCALPGSSPDPDAPTYSALWVLFAVLLMDIAEPPYFQDRHLEIDLAELCASDNDGKDDVGRRFLEEITDPSKGHPLHDLLFPSAMRARPKPQRGSLNPYFNARKFIDALDVIDISGKAIHFLNEFVACFDSLGLELKASQHDVFRRLLRVAKIRSKRVNVPLSDHLDPASSPRIRKLNIDITEVSATAATRGRRSGTTLGRITKGLDKIEALFSVWNLIAALDALKKFDGSGCEKAIAVTKLTASFLDVATLIAKGIVPREAGALMNAPTMRFARFLAGKGFSRFVGGLGVLLSAYDLLEAFAAGNQGTMFGAGIMVAGGLLEIQGMATLLGVAASEASVPVIGLIGAGLTLLGGTIYLSCELSPLQIWVKKGPFHTRGRHLKCSDPEWEDNENVVLEHLLALMCAVTLKAKEYTEVFEPCELSDKIRKTVRKPLVKQMAVVELAIPNWFPNARVRVRFSYATLYVYSTMTLPGPTAYDGVREYNVRQLRLTDQSRYLIEDIQVPPQPDSYDGLVLTVGVQFDLMGDGSLWVPSLKVDPDEPGEKKKERGWVEACSYAAPS